MRSLVRLSLAIDRFHRALARGTAGLLVLMVLVGSYNAIARSIERHAAMRLTSNALLEAQWYLFGLLFLFGAPYTLQRGEHVRVDVLFAGLPRRGRLWIDLVGGVVLLLPFCAFAVAASWRFAAESIRNEEWSSDPGGLPRWPLKLALPLGFALLGLQGLAEIVKRIAALRGVDEHRLALDEPETTDPGASR
ncbi:MAG: TRAP transporter small permease subunit [Planctomycetes bacterium]|nr:TRAP transporter small permease subunit [Planctomycetota bacterium]